MKQSFLNISQLFSKKKAYLSLKKLPIAKWWAITEEGNFEVLVISGKYTNLELYNIYLDLLQEYYDNFGTTETHGAFIEAKFNYAKALAKWISTQNGTDKMFLEMAKIDLQEATPRKEQSEKVYTLYDEMSSIEKVYGPLDEDKLSTMKYYSYRKRIEEDNKQQIEAAKQWQRR